MVKNLDQTNGYNAQQVTGQRGSGFQQVWGTDPVPSDYAKTFNEVIAHQNGQAAFLNKLIAESNWKISRMDNDLLQANMTICNLESKIEQMKNPKERTLRKEELVPISSEGCLYYLRNNGEIKEPVTDFMILDVKSYTFDRDADFEDFKIVCIEFAYEKHKVFVYLPKSKMNPKVIIGEFQSQAEVSFYGKQHFAKTGQLLINYINTISRKADITHLYHLAGWHYLKNKKNVKYTSQENALLPNLPISHKKLPLFSDVTSQKALRDYIRSFDVFKADIHKLILIAYLHFSIGYFFYAKKNILFPQILQLDAEEMGDEILMFYLQVFSRNEKIINSIDCDTQDLHSLMYEAKDEVLLFTDSSEGCNAKHRERNIQELLDVYAKNIPYRRDFKIKEGHILSCATSPVAISSSKIAFEFGFQNVLYLEVTKDDIHMNKFVEMLGNKNIVEDHISNYIDFIAKNADIVSKNIDRTYQSNYMKAEMSSFSRTDTKRAYSVLMTCLSQFIAYAASQEVDLKWDTDSISQKITQFLKENEEAEDLGGIVEMLKGKLDWQLGSMAFNKINLQGMDNEHCHTEEIPQIYYDDHYFYITRKTFLAHVMPMLPVKMPLKRYLQVLSQEGYLKTYDRGKRHTR